MDISHRRIDDARKLVSLELDPTWRSTLGQYMTPTVIADFMASLFRKLPRQVLLLDPGSGIGSLSEAFAELFFSNVPCPGDLAIAAYEIDPQMAGHLKVHLAELEMRGCKLGHRITTNIHRRDFIADSTFELGFAGPHYTHAILNPPYKKIVTASSHRKLLRKVGLETSNLYTAFLGLAVLLMKGGGEIVAIVPRSFCNGTYFRPFRKWLLNRVAITHIHVFESRKKAFKDDNVLQENIIVHLVRGEEQGNVKISSSHDSSLADYRVQTCNFSEVVHPGDPEQFIHIPLTPTNRHPRLFAHTLKDIGLEVSTGPVVDFRLREHWLQMPVLNSAPLLYSDHFRGGKFGWPRPGKKPNAIAVNTETRKWLLPRGCYTLTKRFSSKEERRRVVAYVVDPKKLEYELFGFENHLNVFHAGKKGLDPYLAHGLAVFLNSSILDLYFRSFSGHTQVNATDLRAMRYPSLADLHAFGRWTVSEPNVTQNKIDRFIERYAESN